MLGYYGFPAPVMTPELAREAANRAALHADGLTETPAVTGATVSTLATPRLEAVDRGRLMTAAVRARKAFPGPVGATIAEHLTSWSELGFRFGGASSIAKLVEAVMAINLDDLPPAA